MKVLLVKDVYKLGRAGDVKKVANGFGRNYLIPQGMAVLATPGALKSVERIREAAAKQRAILNEEMSGLAEIIKDVVLVFNMKAGETGKLYGSITSQMIVDAIKESKGVEIDRRNVETDPIRTLGEHIASIRLTMDLIPEVKVIVLKEGESLEDKAAEEAAAEEAAEEVVEAEAEVEAEEAAAEATEAASEEAEEEAAE